MLLEKQKPGMCDLLLAPHLPRSEFVYKPAFIALQGKQVL